MNCESCDSVLIDYVHAELGQAESSDVAAHLTECSSCALAFCRLRADVDGIATAYVRAPSMRVADSLRARVESEFRPSWGQRLRAFATRPVPAYGMACAAIVPLVVWAVAAGVGAGVSNPVPSEASESKPALIRDYGASKSLRDPRIL